MRSWTNLAVNKPSDHAIVAVAPALTVLVAAFQLAPYDTTFFEFTNGDPSQVLNAQLESSASSSGPWYVFDNITFNGIAAGATVSGRFTAGGYEWVRVRGSASGTGLNATCTAFQFAVAGAIK